MKKIMLLLVIILGVQNTYASTLVCQAAPWNNDDESNYGRLFASHVKTTCRFLDRDQRGRFNLKIDGIGPSLYTSMIEGLAIDCPLKENPSGTYYGVDADVGLVLGAGLGVFVGKGLCLVTSAAAIKFGIGVTGARMEITEGRRY